MKQGLIFGWSQTINWNNAYKLFPYFHPAVASLVDSSFFDPVLGKIETGRYQVFQDGCKSRTDDL